MKWFGGLCGLAFLALAFGLVGCNDGSPSNQGTPDVMTKENRPAGFEEMMKGMEGNMKNSATKPKSLTK